MLPRLLTSEHMVEKGCAEARHSRLQSREVSQQLTAYKLIRVKGIKGLSHEMDLAFDAMHGQFKA